ncbi:uncharacterized protein ATC70_005909 [Mucor velutinosus]|uniref:Uncharacterized protein n=1 Tax=Mucor velutinosus TaxID=708070 RepID=A0AAN7DAJ9_9FUNG|nr:hypothetical protein ATC70_005909 [Mucor velutinosus]
MNTAVAWPIDKPIIFNVPVTRNSTFELDIPQAFTSQLPTCNTVWNFFTVDEQGIMDDSEEQSFTVNRVSYTMMGGTFLFPFGGFAGQLIASNYESKGASLYGFEAIDASRHTTFASCWPHLRRDDAMSTEIEPEQEDDLEWMIRRGRQLLPVAISDREDQSPSKQDEISKALASTTTVTEIVLPSEAVLGSSVSSMLSEYSSLLDVLNPQHFFDEAYISQDKHPANDADMEAFANALLDQQPESPMIERPADFAQIYEGPKTTVTT